MKNQEKYFELCNRKFKNHDQTGLHHTHDSGNICRNSQPDSPPEAHQLVGLGGV